MLTHGAKQSYVITRRQNLCRYKLLEEIYVMNYIKICLPSSACLNLYSVGKKGKGKVIPLQARCGPQGG